MLDRAIHWINHSPATFWKTEAWYIYMLQVKIKFSLKFFNLGWFSISFVSALIHESLGLGET